MKPIVNFVVPVVSALLLGVAAHGEVPGNGAQSSAVVAGSDGTITRLVISDVSASSFVWRLETSKDNGKTWESGPAVNARQPVRYPPPHWSALIGRGMQQ